MMLKNISSKNEISFLADMQGKNDNEEHHTYTL